MKTIIKRTQYKTSMCIAAIIILGHIFKINSREYFPLHNEELNGGYAAETLVCGYKEQGSDSKERRKHRYDFLPYRLYRNIHNFILLSIDNSSHELTCFGFHLRHFSHQKR